MIKVIHRRQIPTTNVTCTHCLSRMKIEKRDTFKSDENSIVTIEKTKHQTSTYWKCPVCEHDNPIFIPTTQFSTGD